MAQVEHGIRKILAKASIYDLFQDLVGARKGRGRLIEDYIRPRPDMLLLDIGCGTAQILAQLPESMGYVGFDLSETYIDAARAEFGERGEFHATAVTAIDPHPRAGEFDVALAVGLIHHLDDAESDALFAIGARHLKPGGRMITMDPVFEEGQSRIARAVIRRDRGLHVRTREAYAELPKRHFGEVEAVVRHDMIRIPYSHCVMTCTQGAADS